jgi:RNA polymerase sigma-70 factor (ECF subfamily)
LISDPPISGPPLSGQVEEAGRASYARIVATLIRVTGDWTLAEDCAQEALAAALEKWPHDGIPGNPGGWLMTVARNRAIDTLRRTAVESRKLREVAMLWDPASSPDPASPDLEIVDDRLRLIFTCCHPALSLEARVALTLRTVAGVPTGDIARAFLVTESAMTRRLTRAKTKITEAGIPYRVPEGAALVERLPGVLGVLYLLFTRGYDADGEPAFADEAIRLARLLVALMPDEPEAWGLLALFLLQHSRRDARRDAEGRLVTLDRQDRARWDRAMIEQGRAILGRTPVTGPYAVQARIAAEHVAGSTDWIAVAGWYDALAEAQPTPAVALNRAVAHGYAFGPAAGLAQLADIPGLPGCYRLAAEADLTARAGDRAQAADLFRRAAEDAPSEVERQALLVRAAEAVDEGPELSDPAG